MYSLEVACLSVVKLMILGRMFALASHKYAGSARLGQARRLLYAAVGAANMLGIACNITAAVHEFNSAADIANAISDCQARGGDVSSCAYGHLRAHSHGISRAEQMAAVQLWCESASLMVISAALGVVGSICARRIKSAVPDAGPAPGSAGLSPQAAGSDSKKLRRDIIAVVCVISFTFLLRFVLCAVLAAADSLQNDQTCKQLPLCDTSCKNECVVSTSLCNQQHANCNTLQLLPRSALVHFLARVAKCRSRSVLSLHSARCAAEHDNVEDAGRHALHPFEPAFESDVVLFKSWHKCSRRGGAYGDRLFLTDADARERRPRYPGKCADTVELKNHFVGGGSHRRPDAEGLQLTAGGVVSRSRPIAFARATALRWRK
jgi:hypothetical protein